MKLKTFVLIAGSGTVLSLGSPASAGFLGLSTEPVPNEFGLLTVRVFADFANPGGDHFQVAAGTPYCPLSIQVVGGTFYQHPVGTDTAPNPVRFQQFPSLRYDTFVTIGVESFNPINPGWRLGGSIRFAAHQGCSWRD